MNNLKNLKIDLPLRRLVCVTGVSGSGKSTLVRSVLHDNLRHLLAAKRGRGAPGLVGCDEIRGWESVRNVLEVDQTPIGKTPRSCPATYVGFWDEIRRLFAATPEARMRGYGPSRFSFNVKGDGAKRARGRGAEDRDELPSGRDGRLRGLRRRPLHPETMLVRFKEKNISEVLAMSVDEAAEFFTAHSRIHHALRLLQDVGLGYLTLGQQSPTLSGGEAQRIKLVTELAKAKPVEAESAAFSHSLYVLDEPTIGLHMADVEKLIRVLHRLVAAGNTVVLIEHNLDIIAEADWLIDLGPEGGRRRPDRRGGTAGEDHSRPQRLAHGEDFRSVPQKVIRVQIDSCS